MEEAGRPVIPISTQPSGEAREGPTARPEGDDGTTQHTLGSTTSLSTHTLQAKLNPGGALASLLASHIIKFSPGPEQLSTATLSSFTSSSLNLLSTPLSQ